MDIAIDLGSHRTRAFIHGKGKVLDEASVVTYDVDTGEIYAVGDRAYKMIGKTPPGVRAVYPIDCGVVAGSELAENMVSTLLKEVCSVRVVMPRVVTAVPCGITEVEKRAAVNAVSAFGVRRVYLIESPKAAALGCGVDISSPHGVMVADIGGGTADIAVMSLGGISVSKSVKGAGGKMDEDIIKYIRSRFNLIIGANMAESCKIAVGCVKAPNEEKVFKVKGRDAVTGMPKFAEVGYADTAQALKETAGEIVTAIKDVLEQTPPELTGDIYGDGIILTGGLAMLTGLARLISEETKIKVRVHKRPEECVISGCAKAIAYMSEADRAASGKLEGKGVLSPLLAAY